ncbi:ABC transporter permease [Kordiimonas aquimaris]|uniref:ABC transporter permease n=1 Tax=Kordiimonas aquimaris TaxID=707591 RepID=UPI0021D3B7DF|nr:ABC transporter permease [Kordiimonas aquimaris]
MFKSYLLTALRHIFKNRLFTAINILGLAIGLMSCILILLFVRDELTYDRFMPDGDRIVRLHSAFYPPGQVPFLTVRSAGRMMEALKGYATAEVEDGVRLFYNGTTIIKDDVAFSETVTFADPSFFNVFDLPFVQGNGETAFVKPGDFVISEEMAIKYFGRTDVVGETLTACCLGGEQISLVINGVIKDIPDASHMSIDLLLYMDPNIFIASPNILETWTSVNVYTYFKLREGVTTEQMKERVYTWLDNESIFKDNPQITGKPSDFIKPNIMPLRDIHLDARADAGNLGDITPMGDRTMVMTFASVALLVLIIASINFMNLSTAKAVNRSREVALRKVMGATRLQVALQFLGEALMIAVCALLLAIVGVEMALPVYNEAIGATLELNLATDISLLASLVGAAVLTGLISGSYPAIYLSGYMPARILRSNKSSGSSSQAGFRSALVVSQFAISIGLVICTAVVYGQTVYARSLDVGYNYDNKLAITSVQNMQTSEQAETLRQSLERVPGVSSVVLSSEVPSQDRENNTGFTLIGGDPSAAADSGGVTINYHSVGYGFLEAYNIKPLAGRTFDQSFGTDEVSVIPDEEERVGEASVILNESAIRALGVSNPEEAIGKTVKASIFRAGNYDLTIVGVVPDVYFRSIKFGVRPTAYWVFPRSFSVASVSYDAENVSDLTTNVERIWRDQMPLTPLSYEYVSEMLAAQYDQENSQAELFAAFSILAIVVACLGLYGLASFTAEQRTKEIGIRKVLGATVRDVVQLLVWQFSRPVLIANLIAWPLAWYFMSDWLDGFTYSLGDSYILTVAVISGAVAMLIAWMTVASRAYRVAQTNPIAALRYE